jgi:ribosomal protein S18 acetylase RimI-like enzyme
MVMTRSDDVSNDDIQYINVRKATAADFDAIREVAVLSRKSAFSHFMDDDEITDEVDKYYSNDVLNGILNNPANAAFVAERDDNKILGYVIVLPQDRKGRSRLLQFYVRPDAQRQGVGELLFEYGKNHLKAAGKTEMFVSTVGANIIGRRFFEKKGCRLIYDYNSVWDGKEHTVAVYYLTL